MTPDTTGRTTPAIANTSVDTTADVAADTAVIGGGVVGVCCALALQKTGKKVVLLERDSVAGGASGGNAGHIAAEQVYPIASLGILKDIPKMLLDPLGPLRIDYRYLPQLTPWFIKLLTALLPQNYQHSSRALQAINALSLPAWQHLLADEGLSDLLRVNGSYLLAESNKSLQALHDKIPALKQAGVAVTWQQQTDLQAQLPALNAAQLGGLFFPETAHVVDPLQLCLALQQRFHDYGGTTLHDEVQTIQASEHNVVLSLKHRESLAVEQAVIACGFFSKQLVQTTSGICVPLQAERGYHLMTTLPVEGLSAPVSSFDRRFIMTPMQPGLRLAGTVEYSSPTAKANYRRAENLLALANGMLKTPLQRTDAAAWMGLRPTLPDSLPVIERIGRIAYAFGHQHLGLTQAAVTADWISRLVHEQTVSEDLRPYRLTRFK